MSNPEDIDYYYTAFLLWFEICGIYTKLLVVTALGIIFVIVRKRRSSILKSQRAPRAPLSELEFNVATPQDQAKSRRVSFSRRNGVAEFEINEATTAWKNVYEEHNKSLETSGNESGARPRRVQQLGARRAPLFQDGEAELVADDGRLELSALADAHTGDVFTLAPAARRDATDRLDVDFSAVTPLPADDDLELRRDLDADRRANVSEYDIDVDFNATHFTLKAEESDMSITDSVPGPRVAAAEARRRDDWAADKENIAVNPYVAPPPADYECDDVLVFDGKKCTFQSNLHLSDDEARPGDSDRPPAGPERASETVFLDDGADMTMTQAVSVRILEQAEILVSRPDPLDIIGPIQIACDDDPNVPSERAEAKTEKQRTTYFDDLADISVTQTLPTNIIEREPEVRVTSVLATQTAPAGALPASGAHGGAHASPPHTDRRRTIVYGNDDGDLSVTGVLPTNILDKDETKPNHAKNSARRTTIVYGQDDCDVSITGVVPANILVDRDEEKLSQASNTGRRKTIVYGNDDDNISMTGVVPAIIMVDRDEQKLAQPANTDRRKTIVYGNDDGNVSMTGVVPANIIVNEGEAKLTQIGNTDLKKTIVYGDDDGNISMTGVVPFNIMVDRDQAKLDPSENTRRKTIVYGNDDGNISMTGVVPTNIMVEDSAKLALPTHTDRRKTVGFGNDDGNLSMTGVVPTNVIVNRSEIKLTQPTSTDRRKTIVYGNDDGNISVTGVVPSNIIVDERESKLTQTSSTDRRKSIVYGNDDGNISMTGVVPSNIMVDRNETIQALHTKAERRKTIIYVDDDCDISTTGVAPARTVVAGERTDRTELTQPANKDGGISMTDNTVDRNQTQPTNAEHRKTVVYGNDDGDLSMTGVVPGHIAVAEEQGDETKLTQSTNGDRRKTVVYGNDDDNVSMTGVVPAHVMLDKDGANHTQPIDAERRKTIVYGNEEGDISLTGVVPADIMENEDRPHTERRKTVVYGNDDDNISMTGVVPAQIIVARKNDVEKIIDKNDSRRKTVDYEECDVSMTGAEPRDVSMTEAEPCDAPEASGGPAHATPHTEPEQICDNKNDRNSIAQVPQTPSTDTGDVSAKTSAAVTDRHSLAGNLTYEHLSHSESRNVSTFHTSTVPEVLVYETSVLCKSVQHVCDGGGGRSTRAGSRDVAAETRSSSPGRASAADHMSLPSAADQMSLPSAADQMSLPSAAVQMSLSSAAVQMSLPSTADFASTPDVQPRRAAPDRTSAIYARSEISVSESTSTLDPMSRSSAPDRTSVFGDLSRKLALGRMSLPDPPRLSSALGRGLVLDDISHALGPDRSLAFDVLSRSLALDRASMLEALSPKSALERAAAWRQSPSASVLDGLLDMSSMDAEPAVAVAVAPATSDTGVVIRDDEPTKNVAIDAGDYDDESADEIEIPALEGARTPALEYKDDMEQDEGNQTDWATSCAGTQADDTRALLDALSALTDAPQPAAARRSLAPDRRSMVRSREDLLKDISMAQALMKTEMEQTELEDASPARRGADVVKTLRFDDDSLRPDDDSLRPDDDSPRSDDDRPRLLHKRASVEREPRRAPVIPSYLQDVGAIKDLMDELVKPMAGVSPPPQRAPVRNSQAQADLFPSSQVDLTVETASRSRRGEADEAPVEAGESAVESPDEVERAAARARTPPPMARLPADAAGVILFDHRNPLNNVVLPPMAGAPHKYSPRRAQAASAQRSPSPSHSPAPSRSPSPELAPCATQTEATPPARTEAPPPAHTADCGLTSSPGTEQMDAVSWSGRRRSPSRVAFMLVQPPPAHAELRKRARVPADTRAPDATPKPALKVQRISSLSRSASPPARDEGARRRSTHTVEDMLWECRLSDAGAASTATLQPAGALHESRSADSVAERGSANVVARIDVLPFMGTECSWETRSSDAWSFRLLRARLRLGVRLAHRVQHARWAARADAPLALVVVQHAAPHHDVSDPVAAWCVRLAADALQHAARDVTRAGHVPALLRHGVLLARRALRWARALQHARVALALALDDDGRLALKVANIPLRSVWEVTMRVELAEDGGGAWPRAADVRVARVVAGWAPTHEELERLLAPLPTDWGHVPRTVWKIFKYLKYKRLEDDLVLGA